MFKAEFHLVGTTMSSHVKLRRDKVVTADYDTQMKGNGCSNTENPISTLRNRKWNPTNCFPMR